MSLLTHHAYVAEGDPGSLNDFLAVVEETTSITFRGHPDVWHASFETIGIDDVRTVSLFASTKPVSANEKYIFLAFSFITTEAQNALLKILEDPLGGSRYFLLTPSFQTLLPTIRSRVMRFPHALAEGVHEQEKMARTFLSSSPARRIEMVLPFVSAKDKVEALHFLDALERVCDRDVDKNRGDILESLLKARKALRTRAPSVKLVLEHLALTLP